ncbi:putative FRE ferric reductase-like transmembrane component [Aulographum hederae CBS 113979]|uniref:Putative FRE ferric reductase-like transmembrane component n=1 Tax=Aulographum hederae CBS 113979 TaxID=1176131 RepID=A0A6G1GT91_9PEZI|nr:putative FRE ferric reductase-like transmembrane component [Aulographum hederae CBS 113979]
MPSSTLPFETASLSAATPSTTISTHRYFAAGLDGVDQETNYLFVHIFVASLSILCVLTLFLRVARRVNAHMRHLATLTSLEQQAFWANNKTRWWPWLKQHVLYAPLWKYRHNTEIQLSSAIAVGTLPSRFHTVLLLFYVASNLAYILVLPWSGDGAQIVAEVRGRSGTLAALNLLPTVLFALRNNPLISLLQVSYDTFNLLHRWAGRVMIAEALIHTFAWAANTYREAQMDSIRIALQEPSYQWGLVGTVCMTVILFQAWGPLRHAFYETFLTGHRILVLFAIIGVYVHIDTHKLPQLPWMYIVLILWALEYLFRLARIVYFNFSTTRATRITVQALPSQACRVTFDLARPWIKPKPGCHVHVYMPALSLLTSHPFSVAWTDTHNANALSPVARTKAMEEGALPPTEAAEIDLDRPKEMTTSMSLIIRARTGFTAKLYERAQAQSSGIFTTYGAIEGPYGGHDSLKSYGTVLLFAGGVGITHQVPYVEQLVRGFHAGTLATRKIVLVWSVPNTEALEWVRPWMDVILALPGRRQVLKIMLFVTKPRSHSEVISGTGTVQMFPGRCNPQALLDKELVDRVGAMAVTVCGPGAFSDAVRAAARKRANEGVVDFVEEAFTY